MDMRDSKHKTEEHNSRFQHPIWAAVFAFTAAFLWGWAYPLIKLGFAEFEITTEMTGSKMLFAGIRFFLSGIIILCVARITNRSFGLKEAAKANLWGSSLFLLAFTLLNTTLIMPASISACRTARAVVPPS